MSKVQFEIDLGQAEKNQTKGRKVLTFVYAINMRNLRAGTITQQDLQNILSDVTLANIERLLLNGSLESAKALIESESFQFYSADDKALILNVINNEVFTDY